jgi:hypothetical protein
MPNAYGEKESQDKSSGGGSHCSLSATDEESRMPDKECSVENASQSTFLRPTSMKALHASELWKQATSVEPPSSKRFVARRT